MLRVGRPTLFYKEKTMSSFGKKGTAIQFSPTPPVTTGTKAEFSVIPMVHPWRSGDTVVCVLDGGTPTNVDAEAGTYEPVVVPYSGLTFGSHAVQLHSESNNSPGGGSSGNTLSHTWSVEP